MVSPSTLEAFDPTVESVDDYKERFDFHCTALEICEERQKALFLMRIGREVFVKVKTLASPTPLTELSLAQIVTFMKQHYKKETMEIAERFKFFKQENESLADYLAELRKLVKTCNFRDYLDMALCDQLVCGLHEQKMQKELLCVPDLTIAVATECAKAAEAVNRETKQLNPEPVATHRLNKQTGKCHRCGKQGHTGANCIHRNKCCHYCKNVGHLSSVCVQRKQDAKIKEHKKQKKKAHPTHRIDATTSNSSDEEEFDARHNHVYHTAGSQDCIKKLTTTLSLDGVEILMEIDTGAEHSTIPFSLYKEKLGRMKLEPSIVKLR